MPSRVIYWASSRINPAINQAACELIESAIVIEPQVGIFL